MNEMNIRPRGLHKFAGRAGIEEVERIVARPLGEARCETCTVPVRKDSCRGHKLYLLQFQTK